MNPFRRRNRTNEAAGDAVNQGAIPKPFTLKTENSANVTLVEGTENDSLTVAANKSRPEYELRQDPTYPSVAVAPSVAATQEVRAVSTAVEPSPREPASVQDEPFAQVAPLPMPQTAEASEPARSAATIPSQPVVERAEVAAPEVETVGVSATSRPKRLSSDVKPVISVRDIKKIYQMGDIEVRALRGVDLDIYPGEIMAIMGPSGSGKSTLMNVLGCLDVPTDGVYLLDGVDVRKLSDNQLAVIRSRKIGFVFQSYNLLARTSAVANVELPLLYSGTSGRERHKRAMESLTLVGLGDRLHHHPNELSGGQQQRVAIARALINRPTMILADEPTGNLDSKTRVEIMKLFQRLNRDQGITIVFVTHDPETADYCERVVWIRDGVIARDDRHKIKAGIYAADHVESPPVIVAPVGSSNGNGNGSQTFGTKGATNEVVARTPQPEPAPAVVEPAVSVPVSEKVPEPVPAPSKTGEPENVELPLL